MRVTSGTDARRVALTDGGARWSRACWWSNPDPIWKTPNPWSRPMAMPRSTLLRRERFDAVILDLALAPLDGWCVLATVGNWVERPRLVAIVSTNEHVGRALVLGADLCLPPGTPVDARALSSSTTKNPEEIAKEIECPQPLPPTSPRPTPSGVSA